jgi:Tfp pilus assembly PilM family ATPase
VVDFQILERTSVGARVFAALAPRAKVEEHLQILADAGLDPAIVDFAPLTTLNVLQLFEGKRPDRYVPPRSSGQQGTLAIYRADSSRVCA